MLFVFNRGNRPVIAHHNCFVPALSRLGGDEELFVELAKVVLDDAGPEMERLCTAARANDFEEVASTGHRLKGMLSTFDDDTLTPELQNLIDAARRHDRATTLVAMRIADPLMHQLLERLQEVVRQSDDGAVR